MSTHVALDTPAPNEGASDEVVALSSTALARVRMLIERERRPETAGLRLSVTDGGCSGFRYVLGLENDAQAGDLRYEVAGVRVFVDAKSAPYLNGMQLDYVDGLHGAGFKFVNPNAERTCGCGSSFSV
jgi:iron-sulfur cluster assembly accessory protein